jgi:hypothetical protein
VFASSSEWPNGLRRCGVIYSSQENLPVGVSETLTCLSWGSDMSGNRLWNPAWEPGMSDSGALTQDMAKRPDMSRLGLSPLIVWSS